MNLAALVSGGKDSLYALYLEGKENIKYIISIISDNPESYMFHFPNIHLAKKQAELMKIKFIEKKTKGMKEDELRDLEDVIKNVHDIDGLVTGAVASNYQKTRIDNICNDIKIKSLAPLWGRNPVSLLKNMIKDGFEIMITAVAAPPLDEKWLGRIIDEKCIDDLIELNRKYGIHVLGEGGEYETLVINCPMFREKIIINETKKIWDEKTRSGWLKII